MPHRRKILVVDDEKTVVETLIILLSDLATVRGALTIAEANTALSDEGPFDLLILDFNIGKEKGIAFYRQLKKKTDLPAILISAVRGHRQVDADIREVESLFKASFVKPFDAMQLRETVIKLLSS